MKELMEHATEQSEEEQRRQMAPLYQLCDSWIVGTIDSDSFLRRSWRLREALASVAYRRVDDPASSALVDAFNHADRCALAVSQAIEDVRVKSWVATPPAASRAYHFAQRVAPETILEMERTLDLC